VEFELCYTQRRGIFWRCRLDYSWQRRCRKLSWHTFTHVTSKLKKNWQKWQKRLGLKLHGLVPFHFLAYWIQTNWLCFTNDSVCFFSFLDTFGFLFPIKTSNLIKAYETLDSFSSFYSQVVLIYLYPFRRNSLLKSAPQPQIAKKNSKTFFFCNVWLQVCFNYLAGAVITFNRYLLIFAWEAHCMVEW